MTLQEMGNIEVDGSSLTSATDKYETPSSTGLAGGLPTISSRVNTFIMQLFNYSLVVLPTLFSFSAAATGYLNNGSQADAACQALGASLAIPDVTVQFSSYLPVGSNITLGGYGTDDCGESSQVVTADLCRLAMYVATSNRSGITLEAWLPTNWTGRFLSTGNGGVSGCIQYSDLAYASGHGFATVGANNGHNGTRGYVSDPSQSWQSSKGSRDLSANFSGVCKQHRRRWRLCNSKSAYRRRGWKANFRIVLWFSTYKVLLLGLQVC